MIHNYRWWLDLAKREPKVSDLEKGACQAFAEAVLDGRRNSIDIGGLALRSNFQSPPNAARKDVRDDAGDFLGASEWPLRRKLRADGERRVLARLQPVVHFRFLLRLSLFQWSPGPRRE